ncbi:tyrosine-type recombinase/integrase [Micromonospora sp. NPDC000207]|uniref:tyrosine-type recombinase/integrase n=1 Tax=Micromonospora sp. NPDC000207 TaxID=3154246 RepID=UPI00332BE9EF
MTAGIPVKVSPHALRHTCATLARDAGANLEDVQEQLGHADARATRRYDHAAADSTALPPTPSPATLRSDDGGSRGTRESAEVCRTWTVVHGIDPVCSSGYARLDHGFRICRATAARTSRSSR